MKKKLTNLPPTYNAQKVEQDIYAQWEKGGYFLPKRRPNTKTKKPFVISLPPPNATGTLHLGHAMTLAIEDLMIRYHRLKGEEVLWVPGTDHAAIATQNGAEKKIWQAEKKTRHDLGRDELLHHIETFVTGSRNTIKSQMRRMGASLDWSRERYTLGEGLSRCARVVFKMMCDDGLIYRGNRIVNWCPRCQTTLADDEVEYREEKALFYYFKYGPVVIGTARPETKFLDKTIVVHPDDNRYRDIVGKTFQVQWIEDRPLTSNVIADAVMDPEFGSGAMTITPAHSFDDFDLALRHHLPIVPIINEQGNFTDAVTPEFRGQNARASRQKIVEILQRKGLVDHIDENYIHNLPICYRCETPVEPLTSKQWFVAVNKPCARLGSKTLRERAREAMANGEIEIIPDRFTKTYLHWMDNLRDWCISRQIWFGHRIPVWYRPKADQPGAGLETYVGTEAPNGDGWEQDPDTLDTWFSSGMWTFSTLLKQDSNAIDLDTWRAESPELKRYHPTSVLETGYDILFFWVARMVLMTTYALGEVPFRTVYLHGLVRDKDGRKMSKSLGNVIDPVDMIDKYGADAVRLSLIIGTTPGNDVRLYEEKIAGYRNFVNKLWNISRFILSTTTSTRAQPKPTTLADHWILAEFNELKRSVTEHIEHYRFSAAGEELYEFTWSKFADWYLETAKIEGQKDALLRHILQELLVLWHPFAPFASEHIWQLMRSEAKSRTVRQGRVGAGPGSMTKPLIAAEWPKAKRLSVNDNQTRRDFAVLQQVVAAMRDLRQDAQQSKDALRVHIVATRHKALLQQQQVLIERLGRGAIDFIQRADSNFGTKRSPLPGITRSED